jgi:hypothetical protein
MKRRNFKSGGIGVLILLSTTALLILQLSGGETYSNEFE